jgi:DNA-binding response OmpR family regulator
MSGERVLVVDDEPNIVKVCHRVLAGQGFHVCGIVDPLVGLERIKQEHYDLALIDVQMPKMDGLSLLEAAIKIDPDLCVLMISGYSTLTQVVQASQLGAEGFVLKPFTPEELLLPIHWALNRRASRNRRVRLQAHLPLMDFNQVAISELEPDQVVAEALEIVWWETRVSHAALVETVGADGQCRVLASMGSPPLSEILQKHLVHFEANGYENPLLFDALGMQVNRAPEAAIVCMPLQARDEIVGWLILAGPKSDRPLRQDDLEFLTILSGQIAIALKNTQLYAEVEAARQSWEATFDAITDAILVHSRDHTILQANKAMVAWQRSTSPGGTVVLSGFPLRRIPG